MDFPADGPNVSFLDDAQAFLDSQSIPVQAEVIAIASWLYGYPAVDGDRKFLVLGPWVFGVRQYHRVYDDQKYTLVYDFDEEADPPLLRVLDAFFSAGTA